MDFGLNFRRKLLLGFITFALVACSPTAIKIEETQDIVPAKDKAETHAAVSPTETAQTIPAKPPGDSDSIPLI